jgi:hypothetical protein
MARFARFYLMRLQLNANVDSMTKFRLTPTKVAAMATLIAAVVRAQSSQWPRDPTVNPVTAFPTVAPLCDTRTPLLTADSVGPVTTTMHLGDIQRVCPSARRAWRILEGMPEPVLIVKLGAIVVVAEFADTLPATPIYRLWTKSSAARTVDGVGPGVNPATFAELWSPLAFWTGEGGFGMISNARPWISLSLQLPDPADWPLIDRIKTTRDWHLLPRETRVADVVILPHR